jgi:cysteine-rich repeat protein
MSRSGAQQSPIQLITVGDFDPEADRGIEFDFIGREIAGRYTVRAQIGGGGMATVIWRSIMSDKDRQPSRAVQLTLLAAVSNTACVIEKIDAIIAEHGVTYWPSSSGEDAGHGETSTGTGTTDTSTSDTTGAGTDGHDGTVSSTSSTSEAGTHGTSSGTGSTGAVEPFCGDGVVQGDETCDDGNAIANDGCQECAKDSIVFISSEVYQGYALDGLEGADQRCRNLAAKARLSRPLAFRAWLSTPAMAAADRLLHSRGRYILTNGLVVAQNWDELTSGALQHAIVVDENSQTKEGYAWTGTLANGEPALGSEFCGEWKETEGFLIFGGEGRSLAVDSTWSFSGQGDCGDESSLYCVEQ